ncbi:DMT family transporter [Janthinobacterium aquaticum]|uniref:DMT family transporter n=1 Tax=Janthinobacterium sp. FT58W TaxID=2654254 RepID=UPI001264EDE1|nr:DMT family transporter [Janthinobacterium sp. FT58W]KAB8037347.1 EamA family transporter [Janthinobacterium sp. FT58W]
MSDRRAVALVLLSAAGFGSSAVFAKAAYASGLNPSTMLALRFLIAAALLLPLVWLGGWRLPRGRLLAGYMLMGLMYTAQSQGYFTALLYASSGLCAMLLYAYPVLVTVLALLLGWERLDRRMLALMVLAVAGMAVTLGGKLQGQPIGIALALMAAGVYAVYILFGNSLSKSAENIHPLAACVVILSTAGVANTGMALWQGIALPATATGWLAVCAIALFSTAVAIAAFFAGVAQIGASKASIISTFEPVVTMAFGVGMLGEKVSSTQLLGGVMVLAAVILLAQRPAPKTAALPAVQASAS